ncbi:MAG: hypothetical protein FWC71_02790 [Defluviitaleaceae bacterium]|nr:hypothetical protein [Defluviitaleaceae bacterium]
MSIMATDRELRAHKEEKYFDLMMARRLIKNGKVDEAVKYLEIAEDRTQSGMTAEEIDAVKERVSRTVSE